MQGCNKTGREAHTQQGKYLSKVQRQVRRASPAIQNSTADNRKGERWRVRQKSDYDSLTCHFMLPGHYCDLKSGSRSHLLLREVTLNATRGMNLKGIQMEGDESEGIINGKKQRWCRPELGEHFQKYLGYKMFWVQYRINHYEMNKHTNPGALKE